MRAILVEVVSTGVKLAPMKNVRLVIADLFLPVDFAAEVCAGLSLPALEMLLARGVSTDSARIADTPVSLEDALCGLFDVPGAPVAAISAAFDGLEEGIWLRADPVHLRLQREQVVLLPNVAVSQDEATLLCASLNEHFSGQGMVFFAPHPQRWYVRLEQSPDIRMTPLSQAAGRNIHGHLPTGADARNWHKIFNEIQMLLFAHPLNEAREVRGEVALNSVWLWGNGEAATVARRYDRASSDEVLVEMLAAVAGSQFATWPERWQAAEGEQLLVWTGLRAALQHGELASWRDALQAFESNYAQPLWQALRAGKIDSLQLDVLGGDSLRQLRLTRADSWSFWRRSKKLADYSAIFTQH